MFALQREECEKRFPFKGRSVKRFGLPREECEKCLSFKGRSENKLAFKGGSVKNVCHSTGGVKTNWPSKCNNICSTFSGNTCGNIT